MSLVLSLHVSFGCGRREQIKTYLVPKPEIVYRDNHAPPSDRILAAIVLREQTGWFFKISGANDFVNAQTEDFQAFIRGLQFSEERDKPLRWKVPSGWTEKPGAGMRYATIQIDSSEDKPLEMTVIPLPVTAGNQEAYLLSNINRWRNELGLESIGPQQLSDAIEPIDVAEAEAWIMNTGGRLQPNATRSPPFASMNRSAPRTPRTPPRDIKITYELPPGWERGQQVVSRGGITIRFDAAFEVVDENQRVEVTVTKFPTNMANPLRNINRWRSQIGLSSIADAELEALLQSTVVDNSDAHRIEMTSSEDVEQRETIIAVIVKKTDYVWFIKLRGDFDLVGRERSHFDDFLKSIQFSAKAA